MNQKFTDQRVKTKLDEDELDDYIATPLQLKNMDFLGALISPCPRE